MEYEYIVRYYDAHGMVVKEPFLRPESAAQRWVELVARGHKSVKLQTRRVTDGMERQ